MDRLTARFPAGDAAFRTALRLAGIRPDLVELGLAYTGVSWTLHVQCSSAAYKRVEQLAPEALRADTAWGELCESIADDLAERLRRGPHARSA